MPSLETVVADEDPPLVNKSIALLAISNIYTLSEKLEISEITKNIAFEILKKQKDFDEHEEVVKNLIYSSLVLLYNMILKKQASCVVDFSL